MKTHSSSSPIFTARAEQLSGDLAKSAGPVFDAILKHVENPPPTPTASNSAAFSQWMKHHCISPV